VGRVLQGAGGGKFVHDPLCPRPRDHECRLGVCSNNEASLRIFIMDRLEGARQAAQERCVTM